MQETFAIETDKTLLALQFWGGDLQEAMALATLIADLQTGMSTEADFLFISRFDCEVDPVVVEYVAKKFNVHTCVSKHRGTGWPHGCNGLVHGMLEWFYKMKATNQIPQYKTIFAIETDCVPMSADWISRLKKEWDLANQEKPVFVAGAWLPSCPKKDGLGHINGNALMSGDEEFLKQTIYAFYKLRGNVGWDYAFSQKFKRWGWANIPGFVSAWRIPISEQIFLEARSRGVFWWHGVKGFDALNLCRKHLL